jgi:hypothetical protein
MVGRWLVPSLLLVLGSLPALADGELAKPAFVLKPQKGFIDDPFAIDAASGRLALLRTDSASFALVEIVDLQTGKTRRAFAAGNPQQLFDRVLFAGGDDTGIVLVTRDSTTSRRSAQYFGADGRPLGLVGPVTDFGTTTRGGQRMLVGWDRRTAPSGQTTYVVAQYQLEGLAKVGKPRAYTINKDGTLADPALKVVTWQDGYAQLVGERPGPYDKKKDARQSARAVVLDVLAGTIVSESEIGDGLGWTVASQMRRTRVNRTLLPVITDEQDAVQLLDATGRRWPLDLKPAGGVVQNYDRKSLLEQEDSAARALYFSLSLDPLNPDALGRQRVDKPYLDLFRAQVVAEGKAPETTRLLRIALDQRPVTWVVAGRYAALLRKHKAFSRGGNEIELYAIPAR